MGALCAGTSAGDIDRAALTRETKANRSIEDDIDREKKKEEDVIKLLLLGAGESGKSTLFKQLVHLYGKGFSEEARKPYASIVFTNCILGVKTLIQKSEALLERPDLGTRTSPSIAASKHYLLELQSDADIDGQTAQHMKIVWSDPGIQNTYKHRSMFQLSDSIRYFLDRIESIGKPGFIPSYNDMLHCRARTTGIVETSFQIENNIFRMVDVGGQRNERKKWIHCFEDVTALIFVVAMSEYDQVLYEDGQTNRLVEALDLFAEICNSRWFRQTPIILFLNKSDLLAEKLQTVDLHTYFPAYTGGNDFDAAVRFMREQFEAKDEYPNLKQIYVHVTCATDTSNIEFTFHAVRDIVIKERLKECGLLD